MRRALVRAGSAAGLGCVFVGSAASAIALHLDLAPARRIVCAAANDVLGSIFEGKIVIDEVLIVEAKVSHDDFSGGLRVVADRLMTLGEARARYARALILRFDTEQVAAVIDDAVADAKDPAR